MKKRDLASLSSVAAFTIAAFLLTASSGCGGGKSGGGSSSPLAGATQTGQNTGRVTFNVAWPDRTSGRAVPFAADTIAISVYEEDGTCLVGDSTPDRPCAAPIATVVNPTAQTGGTATLLPSPSPSPASIISDLPVHRLLRFDVKAYAKNSNNTLNRTVPVAGMQTTQTLVPGNNDLAITLASTATTLIPSSPTVDFEPTAPTGTQQTISVSATDAANRLVLLDYNADGDTPQIQWDVPGFGQGFSLNRPDSFAAPSQPIFGTTFRVTAQTEEASQYVLTAHYYDFPTTPTGPAGEKANTSVTIRIGQLTRSLLQPTPAEISYLSTDDSPLDIAFGLDGAKILATDNTVVPAGLPSYGSVIATGPFNKIGGYDVNNPTDKNNGSANAIAKASFLAFPANYSGFVLSDGDYLRSYLYDSNFARASLVSDSSVTTGKVIDLAASYNGAAVYLLLAGSAGSAGSIEKWTPDSAGRFVIKQLSFPLAPTIDNVTRMDTDGRDNLYVANQAAVVKFDPLGKPFNGSDVAHPKFTLDDTVFTNQGVYNPSGERLGTIVDLAADGNYLYVLAKSFDVKSNVIAESGRIHVFHSSNGKWLYSINYVQQTRLDNAEALAANGGTVVIAYRDGSAVRTLQYVNPQVVSKAFLPSTARRASRGFAPKKRG